MRETSPHVYNWGSKHAKQLSLPAVTAIPLHRRAAWVSGGLPCHAATWGARTDAYPAGVQGSVAV